MTSATGETVRVEKMDHIAFVTIDRPEVLNALNEEGHARLARAWQDVEGDDEVWVAVLSGAGNRAFCVGGDLKATKARETSHSPRPPREGGFGGLTEYFDLSKPVIAAVHGWCLGGGFELALACDLIVATSDARFGLTEPRRGLVPTGGGPHRLVRQLPLKFAMELLLTGTTIDAERAHVMGIVNEIVPAGQHLAAATRWAHEILECAPLAVQALKQQALSGLELPLREAVRATYERTEIQRRSLDRQEGLNAFAERRPPRWSGK